MAELQRELLLATTADDRKRIQTSIERVSTAQRNELAAFLAGIDNIGDLLSTITGRATGGPVSAGRPYLVGEKGRPELFVPGQSGSVIPEDKIVRALASMAQMAAMGNQGGGQTTYNQQRTVNMPIYTNNTPSAMQQSAEIAWSMLS
jgi:SLT domain-containing protein